MADEDLGLVPEQPQAPQLPVVADENGNAIQSHSPLAQPPQAQPQPQQAQAQAQQQPTQAPREQDSDLGLQPDHSQDSDLGLVPETNEDRYGTTGQQYIGMGEGLLRGVVSPPVANYAEKALGVPEEDILGREKTNPFGSGSAEAYGMIFSPYGWMKGINAIADGVQGYLGMSKYAPAAAKLGVSAVKALSEGLAYQGVEEAGQKVLNDPDQTAASAATHMGMVGLLNAAVPLGGAAASGLWDAAGKPATEAILNKIKGNWTMGNPATPDGLTISPILKNVLKQFGVSGDNIDKYLALHSSVNAAPDYGDVVFHNVDAIQNVLDNLESSKAKLANAKESFQQVQDDLNDHLKQAKVSAKDANDFAQSALDEANLKLETRTQQAAFDQAPTVVQAVEAQKQKAFDLSNKSLEILQNTPDQKGLFPLTPMYDAAENMQQSFMEKGQPELANRIGQVMDNFREQYGDAAPIANVKSIIQGLRARGNLSFGADEIAKGAEGSFNSLQGMVDSAIKTGPNSVPGYKASMIPTAEAFSLLSDLKGYGDPESALGKIRAMSSNPARYATDMPLLRKLEQSTGIQFTRPIDQFASPALRDAMAQAIPEYSKAQQTAAALDQIKRPEVQKMIQEALDANPAQTALTTAQQDLEIAKMRAKGLNGLTPSNVEGAMKSVMGGKSIMASEKFAHIPWMQGKSVPDLLRLLAIRDAFEKAPLNASSRRVNAMSIIAGGLGSLISTITGGGIGAGAVTGAASIGAAMGLGLDTEGPVLVKKILDKYISMFGDLPKAVGASPEATRSAVSAFIDSKAPINADQFKNTTDYLDRAKKGDRALRNGANAIFSNALPVNPPDDKQKEKLDKQAKKIGDNPAQMFAKGGLVGTYMPEHNRAISSLAMRAVTHINQARPQPIKPSPLDPEMEPSQQQKNNFHSLLDMTQQPLMAFKHVQDGTLQSSHIQTLEAVHPQFYQDMKKAANTAMTEHLSKGNPIPYHLRQGLSMMLGEPLDGTMTPQSMQATIAANAPPMPQTQGGKPSKAGHPTNKAIEQISKGAELYQTAPEARIADRRA